MRQYRALYDQTVANYRQTVLAAFQDVEDNLAALKVLSQATAQQDEAIGAAVRNLAEATVRFRAGLDPYLNVLAAQLLLLNASETGLTFRSGQMAASVQLIRALGGGWDNSKIPAPGRPGD
jgi:outer membrane protein TolC